jgi:hypothetical protein
MRYESPPTFATESPVVRMDLNTTPGCERTTYGSFELLGPAVPPGAAPAEVATIAETTATPQSASGRRVAADALILIFSPLVVRWICEASFPASKRSVG